MLRLWNSNEQMEVVTPEMMNGLGLTSCSIHPIGCLEIIGLSHYDVRMKSAFRLSLLALLASPIAMAAPKLASPFTDHAVLQREQSLPVWGRADPGEPIEVSLAGKQAKTTADAKGEWSVKLPALPAGGPFELKVVGKQTISLKDILVGEVWLCSGQSNMDFTVAKTEKRAYAGTRDAEKEIAEAKFPQIRMFTTEWCRSAEPLKTAQGEWKVCSPETVGDFSAVAYFFGRKLHQDLKVPVGLVTSAYGASSGESWISREALTANPAFKGLLDDFAKKREDFAAKPNAMADYETAMAKWKAAADAAKAEGKKPGRAPAHPDPVQDQHNPTVMFNGMIAPIIPYAVKGAIWYQGESNTGNAALYKSLQQTLVYDWRIRWQQEHFAFHAVLLAGYNAAKPEPADSRLASFREAQCSLLELPETGIVSAADIGEEKDVHPRNKQDVGLRLALSALGMTYGQRIQYDRPLPSSGPVFQDSAAEANAVRLRFRHVDGGLMSKGGPLKGFSIAGADGKFVWADARIEGDQVVVSHASVSHPKIVRYAWADFPNNATFYNAANLPALPFRTDGPAIPAPAIARRDKPAVFFVGDSTVKNSGKGLLGWGDPAKAWFDQSKVETHNRALGGRSSRSYIREGLWQNVRDELKSGDLVLIQMGHNDGGPYDKDRARASIDGIGDETKDVVIAETQNPETVRSYGWYLRQYIHETKAAGATPVICSLVPRNLWKDGKIQRSTGDYALWAKQVAEAEKVGFIDLNELVGDEYDRLGESKVSSELFGPTDHTHTLQPGAELNAAIVARSLKKLKISGWSEMVFDSLPTH